MLSGESDRTTSPTRALCSCLLAPGAWTSAPLLPSWGLCMHCSSRNASPSFLCLIPPFILQSQLKTPFLKEGFLDLLCPGQVALGTAGSHL